MEFLSPELGAEERARVSQAFSVHVFSGHRIPSVHRLFSALVSQRNSPPTSSLALDGLWCVSTTVFALWGAAALRVGVRPRL